MKKFFLTAIAAISLAFMACAPSKLDIQEASSMSDVTTQKFSTAYLPNPPELVLT